MDDFGLILKGLMTKNNITNYRLATDLGISKGTITNYLSGSTDPQASIRSKILDYFASIESGLIVPKISVTTTKKTILNEPISYYYPDVAVAAGLENALENSELTKIPISIPSFGSDVSFVNVFGDSMYPKFCSGEIVGISQVEKEYVIFGHAYVVIFEDGQAFIKYIKRGSTEENWLLASENKKYEPQEFHLSKIRKVFIVKGVITKLTM